jgi:hypothetical protein
VQPDRQVLLESVQPDQPDHKATSGLKVLLVKTVFKA